MTNNNILEEPLSNKHAIAMTSDQYKYRPVKIISTNTELNENHKMTKKFIVEWDQVLKTE